MSAVNFLYRSTKKEAFLTLRLLFRRESKDYVFSAKTKIWVSKHYWEKQHQLKRPRDIVISNLQTDVLNKMNELENLVVKSFNRAKGIGIDKKWLVDVLDKFYNPQEHLEISDRLVDFIDYYIEARRNDVGKSTITKYNTIKRKMVQFEDYLGRTIFIKDIDENFKIEFANYYKKKNYSQNTAQKELTFVKTFCKYARYMGIETHPHMDKLKLEKEKTNHIYLTFEELEKIEKLNTLKPHLDNSRDWLLISCYTGQRVSDFLRFNSSMIRKSKGTTMLEFTQQKTNKIMTLPLHPKVLEILSKRNGDFPDPISDQKYNRHIKEVCRLAKIVEQVEGGRQEEVRKGIHRKVQGVFPKWELVTSHIGRRSFATNNYGKIPTPLLIFATGHSTEAMFLKYIGKSNQDNALELAKYFQNVS